MVTNPWGIAGLVLALFLIYGLIGMVNERRKTPPPDPAHRVDLPPNLINCRCVVLPRETEWFSGREYVPGSPGLYKAQKWIRPGVMSDGSHCDASTFKFMLVWDGKRWLTLSGDLFDDSDFAFRGLTDEVA